jgi:adenine-specific DNA-methyltransferase
MAKNDKMKTVETIFHDGESRKNIPSAELQPLLKDQDRSPIRVAYERRNRDLDPQLVWRGKDEKDWSDLIVHAAPLYIQEHVHPKALIDDLQKQAKAKPTPGQRQLDMFSYFEVHADAEAKTEFYQHDAHWSNRMILGDSLQVMASLAEREGLRGKVQCIYFDPPYGIKFNSNFQWSTTSRDVKDGKVDHITREPEQVKAFRDTWRDGIHSYLTYLRDRLTVARDLLTDSGSIFVQIGDENVHRVRAVMDEVFGEDNFIVLISFQKTGGIEGNYVSNTVDFVLWFAKSRTNGKFRRLMTERKAGHTSLDRYDQYQESEYLIRPLTNDEKKDDSQINSLRRFQLFPLYSEGESESSTREFQFAGEVFTIRKGTHWKTTQVGLKRIACSDRVEKTTNTIRYKRFVGDVPMLPLTDRWDSTQIGTERLYVVQTASEVVKRCILMSTDPGDLVLDPTCGSGTTATVAEQWGRRWITIDTSRVALALARARIMGARYPFYLLADSREGQLKEAEVTRTAPSSQPVQGNIRHGFVYERVPHITLKSIANNVEIDVIWEQWQLRLEPLREKLNAALKKTWQEWEIPREAEDPWKPKDQELFYKLKSEREKGCNAAKVSEWLHAINHNLKRAYSLDTLPLRPAEPWPEISAKLHADWWQARIARQQEIDKSIAAKAEFEYLYDKPYEDKKKVRVAGPFTVESLSPHRTMIVDENDDLLDPKKKNNATASGGDFVQMILENLKTSGVQQAHKEDKISFVSLLPWPGDLICAEGRYLEGDTERRAAIFIGPEFGTVQRADLVSAAREASDADFDVLIACAFSYEAHTTDFAKLGRISVLKARMNADLHMAEDLKNTGKGNLFVIFGEPDIDIITTKSDQIQVKINGVDVFHPNTGEVRSDGADGIACWFIDTDYNEESFFVRHAYFLGANDPYKSLKTTLKAEINEDAWASLNSDISRPFDKPQNRRIAVKVINHLGDEVMKVFKI